jgi:hypothetical protein
VRPENSAANRSTGILVRDSPDIKPGRNPILYPKISLISSSSNLSLLEDQSHIFTVVQSKPDFALDRSQRFYSTPTADDDDDSESGRESDSSASSNDPDEKPAWPTFSSHHISPELIEEITNRVKSEVVEKLGKHSQDAHAPVVKISYPGDLPSFLGEAPVPWNLALFVSGTVMIM